jgi:hypothetical protein
MAPRFNSFLHHFPAGTKLSRYEIRSKLGGRSLENFLRTFEKFFRTSSARVVYSAPRLTATLSVCLKALCCDELWAGSNRAVPEGLSKSVLNNSLGQDRSRTSNRTFLQMPMVNEL